MGCLHFSRTVFGQNQGRRVGTSFGDWLGFLAGWTKAALLRKLVVGNLHATKGTGGDAARAAGAARMGRAMQTGATARLFTDCTACQAATATGFGTGRTTVNAFLAVIQTAGVAGTALVIAHRAPAVMAFVAIPLIEPHMRTGRVVMPQYTANQQEGIGKAAFFQGSLEWQRGFARAQGKILDMGMRHRVAEYCRVGIKSHNVEATAIAITGQTLPRQLDCKRPKADLFQRDRFSGYAQDLAFPVQLQLAELFLQFL